jgi:hypothetical protein
MRILFDVCVMLAMTGVMGCASAGPESADSAAVAGDGIAAAATPPASTGNRAATALPSPGPSGTDSDKPYMTTVYGPPTVVARDPAPFYSPELFLLKGKPAPGDWMAAHPAAPQSYFEYTNADPVRPTKARHTIILTPSAR